MTTKLVNLPKNIVFPVRIVDVHVSAGQTVSAGDPLYTLETADNKRGVIRAPFAGQVSQGPVEPFTSFSQVTPVIGIDVSEEPAGEEDAAPPPQTPADEPPEPAPPTAPPAPKPRPSYGLALLAIVGGACLSVAYAFASIYIPLMIFGVFIPLGIALFLIGLLGSGLRGPAAFRILVAAIGFAANMAALWFTVFWVRWGLDEAILVFSQWPPLILDMIVRLSNSLRFTFGDAKDVLRGSGFTITGVWLLILWGIEAAAFAAAAVLGFRFGLDRQHEAAGAGVRENASETFARGVPLVKGLFIGTLKSFAQIALVFGAVFLLMKYVF